MRKILGCIKKANQNYHMIQEDDVIGVGLSGGKDSIALLKALKLYQYFAPVRYKIVAITLTLGFDDFDLTPISDFCKKNEIDHIIEETKIGQVVFNERNEKHPCGMCARMKRGRLSKVCNRHEIQKLALGHHADDAIETLFMSMFYESRIHTFKPVTLMDRSNIAVIRPLIYAFETDIEKAVLRNQLPVISSPCPADKNTKREYIKSVINNLDVSHLKSNLLHALENKEQLDIWG